MTPTDPTPAQEPERADLIPCQWRICNFAFDRRVPRWDVWFFGSYAHPFIDNGTCLVPECKKLISHDADEDWERRLAELGTGYRLSIEVASTDEYNQREEKDEETENRLRKTAAQTDERTEIVQLEVAGTVISLTQREAALVVYCPEEWVAQCVEITCKRVSAWVSDKLRPRFDLSAPIIGRPVGDRIVYAAVFPRIRPVSYTGWYEGLRDAPCEIRAERDRDEPALKGLGRERIRHGRCELYLGNVSEVDWTTPSTPGKP